MLTSHAKPLVPNFKLVLGPSAEPVTADEFKAHSRISGTDEDDKINAFLEAARLNAEQWTGRAFITQTWRASFDCAYSGVTGRPYVDAMMYGYNGAGYDMPRVIELARPPLISVSSIVSYPDDGVEAAATFSSTYYSVSTSATLGRVMLKTGQSWPNGLRPMDSIVITYTCGYGASASAVPQDIREGILEWAAHMYENREGQQAANAGGAVVLNRGAFIPAGVQTKLSPYRIVRL